MIDIAKVRLLEERVRAVIARFAELKTENLSLKDERDRLASENNELKQRIAQFADGQAEIESGILSALRQLDEIEDSITEGDARIGMDDVNKARQAPSPTIASVPPVTPPVQEEQVLPVPSDDEEDAESGPELDIF